VFKDGAETFCATVDRDIDNRKPVYQFAHLEPIRAALEACRIRVMEQSGQVVVRKSDWDALVALVKGESDAK
jgi:hypothetical protein